jgi:hypothetical protein
LGVLQDGSVTCVQPACRLFDVVEPSMEALATSSGSERLYRFFYLYIAHYPIQDFVFEALLCASVCGAWFAGHTHVSSGIDSLFYSYVHMSGQWLLHDVHRTRPLQFVL